MPLNLIFLALVLVTALAVRPWRLLAQGTRLSPLLATLTLLPWLWAMPSLHKMPLQLQASGACLVVLMLGWPLAVPVLCGVGALAYLISPMDWETAVDLTVWLGLVPATLALAMGFAVRRCIGLHLFVYVLGRSFLGTVVCIFAAGLMAQATGHSLPGISDDLTTIAHWLMAWSEAFLTGFATSVLVAYKPDWLATWSDRLYLKP
jgi:uncharacterized membrane protein